MNKKNILFISLINLLFLPEKVNANCNFRSSDFIKELNTPKEILEIKVSIPKSKKFYINTTKILLDKKKNINPKYKKKYKADVAIKYPFGKCKYKAKIWQNGDWKDHINYDGSGIHTSLNVKLEEGNIMNAVKFKLLIPDTRNGLNEILGALILRNLGFIAPESFETKVNINDNKSIMIFQEDSQKELLERNLRREGPIFEGDESILWGGYKNNNNVMFFQEVSLSRVINWKWFLKGNSSQLMTLDAFKDLQYSYLPKQRKDKVITPNFRKNRTFEDYYFLMTVMNGSHGLAPHNRKFYFNALDNSFEPIYYDGNFKLEKELKHNEKWSNFDNAFSSGYKFPYTKDFKSEHFLEKIKTDFKSRVIRLDNKKSNFINKSLINISRNIEILNKYLKKLEKQNLPTTDKNYSRLLFDSISKNKGVDQKIITSYKINDQYVDITLDNNDTERLSLIKFSKLISKNKYNDMRYIFLPKITKAEKIKDLIEINSNVLDGKIIYTRDIKFDLDKKNKIINIKQLGANGWTLFKDVKLNQWSINFEGKKNINKNRDLSKTQRFNKYGITGCLNFYKTDFNKSSIKINNGMCEDSLNIIKSNGLINSIYVNDAYQDAIDLDFSKLTIKNIQVDTAGNDCFDVSGGVYRLNNGTFKTCQDKALSIGEKSQFKSEDILIDNSYIGISVKDFSKASLNNLNINNNKVCIEAKQKKQEFGGAEIVVNNLKCEKGINSIDSNSSIEVKKNEL